MAHPWMRSLRTISKCTGCLVTGAVAGVLLSLVGARCLDAAGGGTFVHLFPGAWLTMGLWLGLAGGTVACRSMPRRTMVRFVVAALLWCPFVALFGQVLVFEPLKCGYLIHRVQAAGTPAEERSAFELVNRWGGVWEVHLESPPGKWLNNNHLDGAVENPRAALAVELEWLETLPNGRPYRARRILLEKTNIYIMTRYTPTPHP